MGRARLTVENGVIHVHAGASCIGQGLGTVLTQMVAESVGTSMDNICYHNPNTSEAPDSGTTSGSRQTLITGEAARRAAKDLRKALFALDVYKRQGSHLYQVQSHSSWLRICQKADGRYGL